MSALSFKYDKVQIGDIHVNSVEDPKTGRPRAESVVINDEVYKPTDRFWTSLFARFSFGENFFRYFGHDEVFKRVSEKNPSDSLRVCIEKSTDHLGKPVNRLLAVSHPAKPIVQHDELMNMLNASSAQNVWYKDGMVESTHSPRVGGEHPFLIAGDEFKPRFVMSTPVDGYGKPNIALALLRLICANGAVAFSKAFRSEVALGRGDENVAFAITRVLDQFGNDEGYAALRTRMEMSSKSRSSVYEALNLYKLVLRMHHDKVVDGGLLTTEESALRETPYMDKLLTGAQRELPMGERMGSPLLSAFHQMTGDITRLYGLANLDSLSVKRQRVLPVKCTVYDLINFATEIATHYTAESGGRRLQAWVGDTLSNEYDMEGTMDKCADFADFHIDGDAASMN